MLDMSQFHTMSMKIFRHKEPTQKSLGFPGFGWIKYAISLLKTCQITSINTKQAENNWKVEAHRRQVFIKC